MTLRAGSAGRPLVAAHDVLLVDLDGVVYTGASAVPGAVPTLLATDAAGVGRIHVTNNASRTPQEVADQLDRLGLPTAADAVVTSAEAAADHLAARLPAGAPVLVVGGPGLVAAVTARGLSAVSTADAGPAAVVQGFGADVGWRLLAEASYALAVGVSWVVTNRDLTLPTERGAAPGNGAFVTLLEQVTGRTPTSIGKPEPLLFEAAARRSGAQRPLVVGDRLDTDIAGANAASLPSLLVLTGVSGVAGLLTAPPGQRPTAVAGDLTGLLQVQPPVAAAPSDGRETWRCEGWRASVDADDRLELSGAGDVGSAVRCAAVAAWDLADAGTTVDLAAVVERLAADLLAAGRPPRR